MSFGVYVHWPYCQLKCPYCDYNSHVADKIDHAKWREAYKNEINYTRDFSGPRTVDTIFFGGGTPSLMEPETVEWVIHAIRDAWGLSPTCEITLEANPTSVEANKFKAFRDAGVNRVSLGVQSLISQDLKFLGRTHDPDQALKAIEIAGQVFERRSFDLIYARPNQTAQQWEEELRIALELAAGHISLYQLTVEEGTSFFLQHARGEFEIPNQNIAAYLYEVTNDVMQAKNYRGYEVSSYAVEGQESRHNLIYWRYQDYAGIGPGAHGRLSVEGKKFATRAHRAPDIWLQRASENGHAYHPFEEISAQQRMQEALMMGLRLSEGVPISRLETEFGAGNLPIDDKRIAAMVQEGLLVDNPHILQTTPAGRQCLNAVIAWILS